jgi:hypothetical protein
LEEKRDSLLSLGIGGQAVGKAAARLPHSKHLIAVFCSTNGFAFFEEV